MAASAVLAEVGPAGASPRGPHQGHPNTAARMTR